MSKKPKNDLGEVVLYRAEDGKTTLDVRMAGETVWLTQAQIAKLFGRERSVITKHLGNVFKEGELDEECNVQNLHIAGSDKPVRFFNLDVIISVGYRVKSKRGTQFRIWATQTLKEHLTPGCAGPRYTATGLPSPPRVLGTGALICFAGRGRPAVRRTPPAHDGLTPREARLPRTTRQRFALPGAQRWLYP